MSIIQRSESGSRSIGFRSVQLFRHETIGAGSYGAVFKARCNGVVCAAKMVHSALIEDLSTQFAQGTVQILKRFQQECELLSALRHPNIVQYLGTHQDPDSGLPILLMELMDESLTHFLESLPEPVAYHTQVNICRDIALALSFLHSNGIIHRDLSSNNVLLDNQSTRAKVTDFGMSRLGLNPQASYSTLTMCPGTVSYMPPEAVQNISVYSEKMDCFSFGVLIIQTLTRKFPNPGYLFAASQSRHSNSSNNQFSRPVALVPEVERRQNHIREVEPDHPLLPIAINCLNDSELERPSAHELYGMLEALMENSRYSDSLYYDSLGQRARSPPRYINIQSWQLSQSPEEQIEESPITLCDHQRQQLRKLKEMLEYTLSKITVLRQVTDRKKSLLNSSKQTIERSDKLIAKLSAQMKQNVEGQQQGDQEPLYINYPNNFAEEHRQIEQYYLPVPRPRQRQVSGVYSEKPTDSIQDLSPVSPEHHFASGVSQSSISNDDSSLSSASSSVYPSVPHHHNRRLVRDESDDTDHDAYSQHIARPNRRTPVHAKRPEKKSRLKRGTAKLEEHPLKKKGTASHMHTQADPGKVELSMLNQLREYSTIKPSAGKDGYVAVLYTPSAIPTANEQWDAVFAVYPRDIDCGHPFLSYLATLLGSWPRTASVNFQFSPTESVLLEIQSGLAGYHIESNPEQFVVDKKVADTAVCDYTTYPPRSILTIIPTSDSPPRLNAQLTLHGAITKSFLRLKLPRLSNSRKEDRPEGLEGQKTKPTPRPRRQHMPPLGTLSEDDSLTASSVCSNYEDHDGGFVLNGEPAVKEFMQRIGSIIPTKWEGMAYELGLLHREVELIRMNHSSGTCGLALIRTVFIQWQKQSVRIRPTWHLILKALRSRQVGERPLADKVKKHLMAKATPRAHEL